MVDEAKILEVRNAGLSGARHNPAGFPAPALAILCLLLAYDDKKVSKEDNESPVYDDWSCLQSSQCARPIDQGHSHKQARSENSHDRLIIVVAGTVSWRLQIHNDELSL